MELVTAYISSALCLFKAIGSKSSPKHPVIEGALCSVLTMTCPDLPPT